MPFDQLKRRKFITLLGGAAAWPLAARAQQAGMPVIGFLAGPTASASKPAVAGFRQGLRQTGYVEGQNCHIAFRWAEGRYDRFPELAGELAGLPVAVLAAFSPAAALAAIAATKTIPIVFITSEDPVRLGLVASLNRPGGNATGVAFFNTELVGKQFELLRELLPKSAVVGLLVNPASPSAATHVRDIPAATQALGLQIVVQNASSERDLETAFAALVQQKAGGLVIPSDPFFFGQREQLAALAARHALPAIYPDREYVADGGLMCYGASVTEAYRQAGVFTGRILKGDKPADLPVQQAVKVELVVNLKTAKALGLEMPLSMLMRITETIE
jgi:putative tryptophan/tyrosine transport system substrate-binding protein